MMSLEDILGGGSSLPASCQSTFSSTTTRVKTPLKDKTNVNFPISSSSSSSSTVNCSGRYSVHSSSSSSNSTSSSISISSNDLVGEMMKGRIDHLERERLELSMQLQQKEESLRARKLKLESLG